MGIVVGLSLKCLNMKKTYSGQNWNECTLMYAAHSLTNFGLDLVQSITYNRVMPLV